MFLFQMLVFDYILLFPNDQNVWPRFDIGVSLL